ncbi:unnamed protein product [Caenorhabditis auriculariae]|uniref:Uncharacterized protein n=1 Tax=Caenorhabditis auriculariae TaxID=2777116 RepID=A0A8S1H4C1_9PELO|nr:unnamed protein product [Caenorhabditis auriculariae]
MARVTTLTRCELKRVLASDFLRPSANSVRTRVTSVGLSLPQHQSAANQIRALASDTRAATAAANDGNCWYYPKICQKTAIERLLDSSTRCRPAWNATFPKLPTFLVYRQLIFEKQIISPCPSPSPSEYEKQPCFLSTSEFDPVLYREELLRRAYLARFPLDRSQRPDYFIAIGDKTKPSSTVTIEVKGPKGDRKKSAPTQVPTAFLALSCAIAFVFVLITIVHFGKTSQLLPKNG